MAPSSNMEHLADIVPHARYIPSGHIVVVSIVAAVVFVAYKVFLSSEPTYDQRC